MAEMICCPVSGWGSRAGKNKAPPGQQMGLWIPQGLPIPILGAVSIDSASVCVYVHLYCVHECVYMWECVLPTSGTQLWGERPAPALDNLSVGTTVVTSHAASLQGSESPLHSSLLPPLWRTSQLVWGPPRQVSEQLFLQRILYPSPERTIKRHKATTTYWLTTLLYSHNTSRNYTEQKYKTQPFQQFI